MRFKYKGIYGKEQRLKSAYFILDMYYGFGTEFVHEGYTDEEKLDYFGYLARTTVWFAGIQFFS